ncbi:pyrroline-5-carboxylate reductase [Raineyella sp. W15-4]|uniref:pyrroline-5-carboxylate reductase n=1 Tax=Raineyella sp. W15-4 TaxID=3081651 RepID=UPI0029543E90|nr:pyrroline-5-carboxylate reductase [Raineyella sp. W15-4]WOQ16934.1 pyrroline-5-carboxylate reductase [Raineyella sp. W15-4]
MSHRLGIIGFGQMGGAIGTGLVTNGALPAGDIVAWDIAAPARHRAQAAGISILGGIPDVCRAADIILLAVKPQDAAGALEQAAGSLAGKALLSVVAGWSTDTLAEHLASGARLLRIMPNTPAQVAAGAFGLSEAATITDTERSDIEHWFDTIGLVEWVPEQLMDAVTGLSGGIPAYIAIVIEALADGGVQQGLKRPVALRLATQAVLGSAKLLLDTGQRPGALKDAVCSPGGTTIEGVRALERSGFRSALIEAVVAASERARQL